MRELTWLDKVYALMRAKRLTYGEAAAELGRHGSAARGKNRRRTEHERQRAAQARAREERMRLS